MDIKQENERFINLRRSLQMDKEPRLPPKRASKMPQKHNKLPSKTSHGIICYNRTPEGIRILLIKKTNTYAFVDFVVGRYKNNSDIITLFNKMTYNEKRDILFLKFNMLWYKVFNVAPEQTYQRDESSMSEFYFRRKSEFERSFLRDGGARLRRFAEMSPNVETIWEIPKGRASRGETSIDAAIREFGEETGIATYDIDLHIKPYVECYVDNRTIYKNIYYYANTKEQQVRNQFRTANHEVIYVDWFDINRIKYTFCSRDIEKFRTIFANIKKKT